MTRSIVVLLAVYMAGVVTARATGPAAPQTPAAGAPVRLGNFSVSLTVKDIAASHAFYEKLGFRVFMGTEAQKFLIMQNETATIGLFQGAFTRNTLTFNPGWNRKTETLPDFDDVRVIQRTLKSRGLPFATEANETTAGPGSFALTDPDGNPILVDQHVAGPKK